MLQFDASQAQQSMLKLLEQIEHNTRPKKSFQIVEDGNSSHFTTNYASAPIKLDGNFEIALVSLETFYSFPNIDATNNNFKYSADNAKTWVTIKIPEGSYELDDLNDAIIFQMKQNGHYDNTHNQPYIKLSPNTSTLKSKLEIAQGYKVDFTIPNSFNKMLGFEEKWYHSGYNESENIVDTLAVKSI